MFIGGGPPGGFGGKEHPPRERGSGALSGKCLLYNKGIKKGEFSGYFKT